ncbi:hypothetical protein BDR04DRAFT_1123634, partial [Suillus decipiens]
MARFKTTECIHMGNLNFAALRADTGTVAFPTTSGKRPAGTVLLDEPIASFMIPSLNAECVFEQTDAEVRFLASEETDVVDGKTKETFRTCRVPIMGGDWLIGYIPLPMRYQRTWLELSYCIVIHTQMWCLWAVEEKDSTKSLKQKAATLRQNIEALVAQHMLARLLVVDKMVSYVRGTTIPGKESVRSLNEWKIRWCRDWFNTTYNQAVSTGQRFLQADPIRAENRALFLGFFLSCHILIYSHRVPVEQDWNINDDSKALLFPPDDWDHWIDGEGPYSETNYDSRARLPARWHEGQRPGNSLWDMPMQFLYCALKQNLPYTHFEQFLQDMRALINIVGETPDWNEVQAISKQLWMGEMTWENIGDGETFDQDLFNEGNKK